MKQKKAQPKLFDELTKAHPKHAKAMQDAIAKDPVLRQIDPDKLLALLEVTEGRMGMKKGPK
ncbi:MAG: hypothetical protein HC923_02940 [Myxococcales bacterium]|nr:hypothetical protein [Myxococcales bacterium]